MTKFFADEILCRFFFSRWGIFAKYFIADGWQGCEHVRALNMPQVLNMLGFWIYQSSKYASVINIPGFWICLWFWMCQASEYDRVTQDSKYAWMCLIPEYPWSNQNGFALTFPHYNLLSKAARAFFLEVTKFDFFYSSCKYLIWFSF